MQLGVGSEVSKAYSRPSVPHFLPAACGSDVSSQLLLQGHACLPTVILPTMVLPDSGNTKLGLMTN